MKTVFLVIATIITVSAVLPYLRDVLKGTTKPNIVSWITWTLITGIATAAEIAGHEYVTAIFTGAAMIETASVVAFGLGAVTQNIAVLTWYVRLEQSWA